jgi:hypothetical protein
MATATTPKPKPRRSVVKKDDAAILAEQGFPYTFQAIELDSMFIDAEYQRPLSSFVTKIQHHFNPLLVGTLILSLRGQGDKHEGMYALVDGQTRWSAMQNIGKTHAPCIVMTGMTQADEAKLFSDLQYERQNIVSYYHFRADLVAGNKEALAVQAIVTQAGYKTGTGGDSISAVVALRRVYQQGPDVLERTLTVMQAAWGDKVQPDGPALRGMGMFFRWNPDADDERLARRLQLVSLTQLRSRAGAVREASGGSTAATKYTAKALEYIYSNTPSQR